MSRFARPLHSVWCALLLCTLLLPALPAPAVAAGGVNADDELKTIRNAYTIISRSFYREPDTLTLLTNAQAEAARQLKTGDVPLALLPLNRDAQFDVFAANLRLLNDHAAEGVSLKKGDLAHAVVRDYARTLNDLHTYFLDEAAADAQRRRAGGDTSIVNFGILAVNVGGEYAVKNVVEGSPVQKGGLLPGDVILSVDGQPLTWENRSDRLGAPKEGQTYALRLRRPHVQGEVTLDVKLFRYSRPTLAWSVVDGHIGYIRTFAFFNDIPGEFDKALADLHRQGVDSLIVDFRGNGGGVNVERVVGRFLPNGTEIGRTEGRTDRRPFVANSERKPRETLPLVVLVDETSGSASEIAALALREFNGVTLIGAKTSGAVGTTRPTELNDGTMLAITISEYISQRGAKLNGVGVTPDIAVSRSTDDIINAVDPQLDAAVSTVNGLVSAPTPALRAA